MHINYPNVFKWLKSAANQLFLFSLNISLLFPCFFVLPCSAVNFQTCSRDGRISPSPPISPAFPCLLHKNSAFFRTVAGLLQLSLLITPDKSSAVCTWLARNEKVAKSWSRETTITHSLNRRKELLWVLAPSCRISARVSKKKAESCSELLALPP